MRILLREKIPFSERLHSDGSLAIKVLSAFCLKLSLLNWLG